MNEPIIESIFPTPVMFTKLGRDFTSEELNFVNKHSKLTYSNLSNVTSKNTYILDEPELANIKQIITETINTYIEKVDKPKSSVKLYVTQSWLNYTKKGGYHHSHNHPNSYISGIIYFNVDSIKDSITFYKSGYNQLEIDTDTPDIYNSKSWWFNVKIGDIVIFPSSLVHGVNTVTTDKTRISLSFNTFFKGVLGSKNTLSELINA
jgi:uncharacterized protein (TIGR02466 family)